MILTAALCVAGCGPDAETPTPSPTEPTVERAVCPPTPPLRRTRDSKDAEDGRAAQGAEDVLDLRGSDDDVLATIAWMLDWDVVELRLAPVAVEDLARVQPMGPVVLAALASGVDDPGLAEALSLGIQQWYACARGLPTTLEGFRLAVLDFAPLPGRLQTSGRRGRRLVRRDDERAISVAQTLDGDRVVETEIAMGGAARKDGLLDLFRYDEQGRLDMVTGPTTTCRSWHRDPLTGRSDRLRPRTR